MDRQFLSLLCYLVTAVFVVSPVAAFCSSTGCATDQCSCMYFFYYCSTTLDPDGQCTLSRMSNEQGERKNSFRLLTILRNWNLDDSRLCDSHRSGGWHLHHLLLLLVLPRQAQETERAHQHSCQHATLPSNRWSRATRKTIVLLLARRRRAASAEYLSHFLSLVCVQ